MNIANPKKVLAYWILEREAIRRRKESELEKPWSDDWVFQQTYFCNVRREDDRVTRWIRQNWSPEKIGWEDYEYAMTLARFLNWPDTLVALTYATGKIVVEPEKILTIMEDRAAAGIKVWGNAYVVTTHGIPMGKATYLCRNVLPAAYDLLGAGRWRQAYPTGGVRLAQRYEDYIKLEGVGSFMAGQILADLKNTPGHPLHEADDWYSWSIQGPGSIRGLNWFHGTSGSGQYQEKILGVKKYLEEEQPEAANCLRQGLEAKINMQDLQNCLCEYDKYMRVRSGSGRSKRGYAGK